MYLIHGNLFYFIIEKLHSATSLGASEHLRGTERSIENDASQKISAQSRNLGVLNKSLGISSSLYVEQSRIFFYNLKVVAGLHDSCCVQMCILCL